MVELVELGLGARDLGVSLGRVCIDMSRDALALELVGLGLREPQPLGERGSVEREPPFDISDVEPDLDHRLQPGHALSLSPCLAFTADALLASVASVLWRELMAVLAVGLCKMPLPSHLSCTTTPNVLRMRDRLQMRRIDTARIPTEVIQFEPDRDRAYK